MSHYIISIDIETSGPNVLKNGIIAIGYCVGDEFGNVVQKSRIHLNLESDHVFDVHCQESFWNILKNKHLLKIFKKNSLHPCDAIYKFIEILDNLDREHSVTIISDNPSFDISFINFYVSKYMERRPISFKFGKECYRPVLDSKSFIKGVVSSKPYVFTQDVIKRYNLKNDHLPDNDAEVIYYSYIEALKLSVNYTRLFESNGHY